MNPTKETYTDLQRYYDLFNKIFFENKLPNCLITYQRGNFMAYYCPRKFQKDGQITDEIAMNPQALRDISKTEVLQTLLHEQCHMFQEIYGKPSRGGYHNREWANIMKKVGLQPFGVGKENYGKETGQKMNDKVIPGGPFEKFILEDSYRYDMWVDTEPLRSSERGSKGSFLEQLNHITSINTLPSPPVIKADTKEFIDEQRNYLDTVFEAVQDEAKELAKEQGYKLKYNCKCGVSLWGKANLKILCLDCKTPFIYSLE